MSAEQAPPDIWDLAEKMSMAARNRRLRAAGMDPNSPCVPFKNMPPQDQAAWLSAAWAAKEVLGSEPEAVASGLPHVEGGDL